MNDLGIIERLHVAPPDEGSTHIKNFEIGIFRFLRSNSSNILY